LDEAAIHWNKQGRPDGILWRPPDLDLAEDYYNRRPIDWTPLQIDFLSSSTQSYRIAKTRETRNKYTFIALGLGLTVLAVFTQQQFAARQFQEHFSKVLIGGSVDPKLIYVLPKALQIGNQQANNNDIEASIETYKAVLVAIQNFTNTSNLNDKDMKELENLRSKSEMALASVIEENYIKQQLEPELNRKLIGGLNRDINDVTQFENQYTEGALKTTYRILMRKPGLDLDENGNGRLDLDEVLYLPCQTLNKINELWQQATNGLCSFYGEDFYSAPECKQLSGETLSSLTFHPEFGSVQAIEDRLKNCSNVGESR
jgi:hypothetical protein